MWCSVTLRKFYYVNDKNVQRARHYRFVWITCKIETGKQTDTLKSMLVARFSVRLQTSTYRMDDSVPNTHTTLSLQQQQELEKKIIFPSIDILVPTHILIFTSCNSFCTDFPSCIRTSFLSTEYLFLRQTDLQWAKVLATLWFQWMMSFEKKQTLN